MTTRPAGERHLVRRNTPIYGWRRLARPSWLVSQEAALRTELGNRLIVIEVANRKQLQLEAVVESRAEANLLKRRFGGRVEKLPRDWLSRFLRENVSAPLSIGKRLIVLRSFKQTRKRFPRCLIIPAGAAFGTGEHVTTAMSLRLLETLTRRWKPGWKMVDMGTGSGILVLAANRFGAKNGIGIDVDSTAIATARENARLNRMNDVQFQVADVRRRKLPLKVDIVTANLFSELLIAILPKLKQSRYVILSGILRNQWKEIEGALEQNRLAVLEIRRRGKWLAILASSKEATAIDSAAKGSGRGTRKSGKKLNHAGEKLRFFCL